MRTKLSDHRSFFRIALGALLIGFFLLGMVFAAFVTNIASERQNPLDFAATSAPGTYFDHVVFIIMENHALSSITASTAPYMHSLGVEWANSTHYAIPGSLQPSLPNYLALTGGSNFGITSDCSPTTCPVTAPNIVDRLDAGRLTWKAYMEDYPLASGCTTTATSNQYAAKHNPFVYYQDIVNNSTRCQNIRSANSVIVPCCNTETDDLFLADLNATSPANYIWLTPDLCDDMHDCSVGTGNTYLSRLVPKILGSVLFQTSRAVLVITFDEAGSGSTAPLYWVPVGPQAKTVYTSNVSYTHYNWLATIESNWSLNCLVSGNDCGAKVMSEFFSVGGPKLVFTTVAQTLTAGVCSATITVQTQNSSGNPFNVTTSTLVSLTTSSSSGTFYSNSACTTSANSVTIATGTNSASFFYKDTTAGSATITASNTGLTTASQAETVNSATPAKLAFTSASQVTNTGLCSAGIKVQTQDSFGNPTTAGANVALSTTSLGGTIYSDAACTTTTASISIIPGSSTANFFYKDTVIGSPTITASAAGLTSATQTESIVGPGPVKLVFATPAQALTASVCGSTMTVQTQNSAGTPTNVVAQIVASLSTNSSSGTFYSDSACTTTITTVTIAAGTDNVSFFYRDSAAGTPNLIASSSPLSPATQIETVKTSQPSGLQATFTDSPSNPQLGQSISFAATATGGGSPYVFKWDFGDGSSGTGQTISHLYQKAGSYTTGLTVTDAAGDVAAASHVLTVAAASPSSPGGICLQCLVRTLPLSSLFLIGLAIGLALTASMMALAIRRNRRMIRRLVRLRNDSGNSLRYLGTLD